MVTPFVDPIAGELAVNKIFDVLGRRIDSVYFY